MTDIDDRVEIRLWLVQPLVYLYEVYTSSDSGNSPSGYRLQDVGMVAECGFGLQHIKTVAAVYQEVAAYCNISRQWLQTATYQDGGCRLQHIKTVAAHCSIISIQWLQYIKSGCRLKHMKRRLRTASYRDGDRERCSVATVVALADHN